MTHLQTDTKEIEWIQRVRNSLQARGYYYEPDFCTEIGDAKPVITVARLLGHLYVPPDTNPSQPVILTKPSPLAPEWRPFDQPASIGWHNDFSTCSARPQLSLSWIRQGDPAGLYGGAWRVASAAAVLTKLRQTREGNRLVSNLSTLSEPFGYRDTGRWRPYPIIVWAGSRLGQQGLRFYGRALEEGAWLRFGQVPNRTREIIARIEEAANSVGEVLYAPTGSLLIVDNRLSLHDRMKQQVAGPRESRRQAWLCFVKRLHHPL
jgi:hypothetical protein